MWGGFRANIRDFLLLIRYLRNICWLDGDITPSREFFWQFYREGGAREYPILLPPRTCPMVRTTANQIWTTTNPIRTCPHVE